MTSLSFYRDTRDGNGNDLLAVLKARSWRTGALVSSGRQFETGGSGAAPKCSNQANLHLTWPIYSIAPTYRTTLTDLHEAGLHPDAQCYPTAHEQCCHSFASLVAGQRQPDCSDSSASSHALTAARISSTVAAVVTSCSVLVRSRDWVIRARSPAGVPPSTHARTTSTPLRSVIFAISSPAFWMVVTGPLWKHCPAAIGHGQPHIRPNRTLPTCCTSPTATDSTL
jgi:hypothetical protein